MAHSFLNTLTTPSIRRAQEENGSRAAYARFEGGPQNLDLMTEEETQFIAARDTFFMASVTETGWPYVQHRGGPKGFVQALDAATLAFPDFRGNKQYISTGNIAADGRVALIFMDFAAQRRLKVIGRARAVRPDDGAEMLARLMATDYRARPERLFVIDVAGFDWNCPQHIMPRYTAEEVAVATKPLRDRLEALERENAALRNGRRPD